MSHRDNRILALLVILTFLTPLLLLHSGPGTIKAILGLGVVFLMVGVVVALWWGW